jgi:hypothetical protein
MKLLFKRDEQGDGFPSTDQISIGELVMNSVTGKLYTKLTDGSVVEFVSQSVCFDPIPTINTYYENALMANDTIENYCCLGAILEFEITQLKPEPYRYSFEFVELTTNTNVEDIIIQDAKYSDYTIPKPGTTTNETISVRRAILPINLAILNNQQNISIFKFSVISVTQNNKKLLEKIVTIKCQSEII